MSAGLLAGVLVLAVAAPPEPAADVPPPSPAATAHRDAVTRFAVGVWQARRDRLLSAARSLEAAAKQDPDSTAALKELVTVYAQIGREPDAIRVARTVLEKDPHDADTAHALARLLNDAGEFTEAAAVAKVAAENVDAEDQPDRALAVYRDLATLLDKTNDPAGSAAALRKAVDLLTADRPAVLAAGAFTPKELDAETATTYERLGKALTKQGKGTAAVGAFQAAHKLYANPDRANDPNAAARLDWNLSAAYTATGEPGEALTHLEAFLKLRPQAVEPYERFAALVRQTGRGDPAFLLQKLSTRDPKNLPLLAVLGAELARGPDTRPQADAVFTQVLAATNDPKVLRVVVQSHIDSRRPREIVSEIDKAYTVLGDDPSRADDKRAFAAEKVRALAGILRGEKKWAQEVLRAGADDLQAGTRRAHQTWSLLGTLAAQHRRLDLAALQFRQALRGAATPEAQGEAYGQLINVYLLDRKPADVAAVCREGLRQMGLFHAYFNFHLSLALAQLGDADEAVAVAEKAIAQAGGADRLAYRLRLATVLKTLGRWDDAVAQCKKLLGEVDAPADRTRVRYALSAAYSGAKKPAEAEAELRGILDADPDHAGAANDLGYHLAEQGRDLDEAERLVRHAVAVDRADRRRAGDPEPENAAYLDSLAWVLFRRGKLPEARDLLEKVSAMPDGAADGVVWDHLGDVRFRLGDRPEAKAAWERAAERLAADARGKRDGRLDEVRRKLKRVP